MTKFFNKLKKTLFLAYFCSIFQIFGTKRIFPENPDLPCTTWYGFQAPCKSLEKNVDIIPRKHLDRWKDGQKDRRTDRPYFIAPFWLMPGVQLQLESNLSSFRWKSVSV